MRPPPPDQNRVKGFGGFRSTLPPFLFTLSFLWFQPWPADALEMVANKFLETVKLADEERVNVVTICQHFHVDALTYSNRYVHGKNHLLNPYEKSEISYVLARNPLGKWEISYA